MFDLLMRDASGVGVPVPLPGRGLVYLGDDGILYTKGSDGAVLPLAAGPAGPAGEAGPVGPAGPAGAVLADYLGVGAYVQLKLHGITKSIAGQTVTSTGANLRAQMVDGTPAWMPAGQVWRYMCGPGTLALMQRVS